MSYRAPLERITDPPRDPRDWGAKCDQCPLNGSKPVFGDGNPRATHAIVGEAPGREEVKAGIPFTGKSGELLEAYIGKHGFTRSDVWIDNAIICFPPGGDLKSYLQGFKKQAKKAGVEHLHPVDACRPRLFTALRVPKCRKCGRWTRGPDALICRCVKPLPVPVNPFGTSNSSLTKQPSTYPISTALMGNFAMQSVLGFDGITAHHSYVENMVERRERLVQFVQDVHEPEGKGKGKGKGKP